MVTLENLKKLKIWVTYRVIDGRKIPFMPDGPAARADDPETWSSYADCCAADNKNGIGFELTPGFAVCDLDWKEDKTCTPFETIPAYAQKLIDGQDTYTEFSPSGLGVHMIVLRPFDADPFTINNKSHSAGVEVYTQKHYFTLTERRVPGTREDFTGYDPTLFSVYMRESARPEAAAGTLHVETASGDICEGGRNETLHKIACGKRGDGLEYDEILAEMLLINRQRCKPMLDLREVHNIVQSACKHPAGERKEKPAVPGSGRIVKTHESNRRLVGRWGHTIKPEPLLWTWKPVLPMGALIHFGGASSNGKSPVTIDLAARISRGAPWPDGTENEQGPRRVIMLNVEDRAEDTIMPRYILAGGDPKMLFLLDGTHFEDGEGTELERMLALDKDIGLLAELARDTPDLGFMSADPITNYLGSAEMNKEAEVRRVLTPVAKLAQELMIPIVTVGHHNKSESRDPLQKMMGAAAFVGVARAVWSFGPDPDGETPYHRMMAPARGNIGHQAMKYHTEVDEHDTVRVCWDGWGSGSAEDTVTPKTREEKGAEREAAEAIRDLLKDGPREASECRRLIPESCSADRVKRLAKAESVREGEKRLWKLEGQMVQLDLEDVKF